MAIELRRYDMYTKRRGIFSGDDKSTKEHVRRSGERGSTHRSELLVDGSARNVIVTCTKKDPLANYSQRERLHMYVIIDLCVNQPSTHGSAAISVLDP